MTETLTLFFPCDVIPVRVRFGFQDTLSPIEAVALHLIASKSMVPGDEVNARELTRLLGLSQRVVLDLLHDLWRQGYVMFDFARGKVRLGRRAGLRGVSGSLDELPSAETIEQVVEVMIDRIGGQVVTSRPLPRPERDTLVRYPQDDYSIANLPHSELLRALRRGFARSGPAQNQRDRRLLTASIAPDVLESVPVRRWLPVEVRATRDEGSGRLIVDVVDEAYPESRKPAVGELLAELAELHPGDAFVKRLEALAERTPLQGLPSPADHLDGLADRAARASGIAAGQRWNWHTGLARSARALTATLDRRFARECHVEAVSAAEHPAAVGKLIRQARVQVVLVSPWITYEVFNRYEPLLADARRRGVQVVVVWGVGLDSSLDDRTRNSLNALARQKARAPLVRSQISARTHAKAVLCDDRMALVTSQNVLASGSREEAGLLVGPPTPGGPGSPVVMDLLRWVRRTIQDGPTSRLVLCNEDDFTLLSPRDRAPGAVSAGAPLAQSTETHVEAAMPVASAELDEAEPDRVAVWAQAWERYTADLRASMEARPLPSVELVADGRHRQLLWQAIAQARRRLVLTSDRLSGEVVDNRFTAALRRRLEEPEGPLITVVYGRARDDARSVQAVSGLRELADAHPGRMLLLERSSHTKVLVCDDDVLVGSFNYLSYAGFDTLGTARNRRTELSLSLRDRTVADTVAGLAGVPAPKARPVPPPVAVTRPEATAGMDPRMQRIVDPLLAAAHDPARLVAAVTEHVPPEAPWPVLDALESMGVAEVLRVAVPAVLARVPQEAAADAATVLRWRRWLTADLWERGRFVEAAVLRCADRDPAPRPGARLAVVGATRGTAACPDALLDAAVDDPSKDEAAALVAVAAVETLRTASMDAATLLDDLVPLTCDPWPDLTRGCKAYQTAAAVPLRPGLLDNLTERRQRAERTADAWTSLAAALGAGRQLPGKIDVAKKILVAFFQDSGPFGRLAEAVERRDPAGVASFLASPLDLRGDIDRQLGQLIDRTRADVAPNSPLLQFRYRQVFLRRLRPVVEGARLVVELADNGTEAKAEADMAVRAAAALQKDLSALFPALRSAMDRLDGAERSLAGAALADLAGLLLIDDGKAR